VVAPASITFGSVAGEPMVLVDPASPLDTTTVVPAATAASSKALVTSCVESGIGLPPKDSLSTSTWSTATA
jgi:hypothetical protein